MTKQNHTEQLRYRKGIFQTFDAQDHVIADERWRWVPTLDGGWRIDTETARIQPAQEPRNESVSLELDAQWRARRMTIYALRARRECQARISASVLDFCWRADESSINRTFSWAEDCEIDYNSALFSMVAVRHIALFAGQSRAVHALCLNPVSFEPGWMRQNYRCHGEELHNTRFGVLALLRFEMISENGLASERTLWCDAAGLVYEMTWNGGCIRLVAVNLPGESKL